MNIINGIHQVTSANKLSIENEVKEIEIFVLEDYRKITVQKRTIKDKTYTSYVLGIPDYLLTIAMNDFFNDDMDKKEGFTVLEKIADDTYKYLITDELKPGIIKLDDIKGFDGKDKTYITTLPKKKIKYLQAYDEYIDAIKYVNEKYDKEFKANPINAHIFINIAPASDEYLQKEVIIRFYTPIDDKFKNSIELINNKNPEWLDILTDVSSSYAPCTFT